MRRSLLPAVVFAVVIVASVLAGRANDAADPPTGSGAQTEESLATSLFSARRAPEWLRQPTTDEILQRGVSAALAGLPDAATACLAVHRDGELIVEVDADVPLISGELQRFTTVAALETVGTGEFTTEVVRSLDTPIEDGVLQGDLYLIGGADPVLSTPAFIDRFGDGRAFTSLPDLALATVDALGDDDITAIAGSIVGVDLKYVGDTASNTGVWSAADVASNVVGVTDGLLLDNGFAAFDPETPDPDARVRTGNPELHAAESFAAWLGFFGIPAGGAASGAGPDVGSRQSVAAIDSPPMVDIARRAFVDATTAEMLYRELAVRNGFVGDLPVGGFLNVSEALVSSGLVADDEVGNYPGFDGSGLALGDRTSCGVVTAILDGDAGPLAPDALTGLGAAAAADCLPAAMGDVDLVASARPEVTTLAGRATAANDDVLTFSLIVNWGPDEATGALTDRAVCDDVVPALLGAIAAHPGGPALDDLTPLPVVAAE